MGACSSRHRCRVADARPTETIIETDMTDLVRELRTKRVEHGYTGTVKGASGYSYYVQLLYIPYEPGLNSSRFAEYRLYTELIKTSPQWVPTIWGLHNCDNVRYVFQNSDWRYMAHCRLHDAPASTKFTIARQLLGAVCQLHQLYSMMHGNLNGQTIGLDSKNNVQLVHLGTVSPLHDLLTARRQMQTVAEISKPPESMIGLDLVNPRKCDAWMIGVLLFELCTGAPFYVKQHRKTYLKNYQRMMSRRRPVSDVMVLWQDLGIEDEICHVFYRMPRVDRRLRDVITLLLTFNPLDRATPYQAYNILAHG